ncbi:MAG: DUF167 domain-containing protein [Dehalococcoidia bacterium]
MSQNQTNITVQIQPNAKRNEVLGFEDGVLRVKIAAPPVRGKANKELIDFLSGLLGVNKSSITIEKGVTSRRKVIAIEGLSQAQILQRLGAESRE